MIEFISYPGGRTAFNEDFDNLRDLALSFSHFFDDCGINFVISGCEVWSSGKNNGINSGYVWLDGKVRKFDGANNIASTVYIIANDSNGQTINYSDKNVSGYMSANYGAELSTTKPNTGGYIAIVNGKGNYLNSFFSHYAMTKNCNDKQVFNNGIEFQNLVSAFRFRVVNNDGFSAEVCVNNNGKIEVDLYDKYSKLIRKYIFSDGIKLLDKNENEIVEIAGSNNSNDRKYLPTIKTNTANVKKLYSDNIIVNGSVINIGKLDDFLVTDWVPMLYTNLKQIEKLFVKNIGNNVYISGILNLLNAEKRNTGSSNAHSIEYKTNIMIPSNFEKPRDNTQFVLRFENSVYNNFGVSCRFDSAGILYFTVIYNSINSSYMKNFIPGDTYINWHYQY